MANVAYDKSFEYAVEIVALAKELTEKRQYGLANQLLRSGTSVGANISESEYAQSRTDFISKMSISLKEASESRYWLRLLKETGDIAEADAQRLISQADEIIRILTASIKTAKQKV